MTELVRTIEIYADTRGLGICRGPQCGATVVWAEIVATHKRMCFDPDVAVLRTWKDVTGRVVESVDLEANHWATCPDARQFKKKAKA